MSTPPLMACGHAANATTQAGQPVCAICVGIDSGSRTPAAVPDLTGRQAVCSYANGRSPHRPGDYPSPSPSTLNLPFFKHRPSQDTDTFYCGCFGWD